MILIDVWHSSLKLTLLGACLICALLSTSLTTDADGSANSKSLPDKILFQCPWKASGLTAKIVVDKHAEGILQISKNNQTALFSYEPGLYPDALINLNDGNLATLWTTGLGSYCHLRVFAYSKGKVHLVLQTVSEGLGPEFVYQPNGHIMGEGFKDKNGKWQVRGGPFFQQRIIVPNVEWVLLKKSYLGFGNRDKQPVTADIYTWDQKTCKYIVRSKVPWLKRLHRL